MKKFKDKELMFERIAAIILRVMVIVALLFPVMTSAVQNQEQNGAYPEKILVNGIALIFIIFYGFYIISKEKIIAKNRIMCCLLGIIIIVYINNYLDNILQIQWGWQAKNTLISFGIFWLLSFVNDKQFFDKYKIIEFTIFSIVITNLIGIFVYLKGYLSMHMYDGKIAFIKADPLFYEKRFNWIYSYKCQYAMLLILFVAFFVANKNKFKNKVIYICSLGIMFVCLWICHTNTAIIGSGVILFMDFVDYIINKRGKNRTLQIISLISFLSVGVFVVKKVMEERNFITLGNRIPIWKATIEKIKYNPLGLGNRFTFDRIWLNNGGSVPNGHNIFLNEILRLGIAVGICFVLFFLVILIFAILKKPNFLNVGICIAFLMQANMDYSILPSELTMCMFMFFCIFFYPYDKAESEDKGKIVEDILNE